MAGYQVGDTILKVDEIQELTAGAGLTLPEVSITVPNTGNVVGLAVTGNDTTNNPDTVTITTTTTGNSLTVDQNGSVGVDIRYDGAIHVENTGSTGIGVGVYSDIDGTASAPLLSVLADNIAFDQNVTSFITDGTLYAGFYQARSVSGGRVLQIDQDVADTASPCVLIDDENTNGAWGSLTIQSKRIALNIDKQEGTADAVKINVDSNAIGLNIDKDVTDENATLGCIDINQTSVVTDAATYTKSGRIARITSAVTETSGAITDTAVILELIQSHADATGDVIKISNAGTSNGITVDANGNVGTSVAGDGAIHIENTGNTGIGLGVYSNIGATADVELVSFKVDNAAFDHEVVEVFNDGAGIAVLVDQNGAESALKIDHDDTGANPSQYIDRDGDNAADIYALKIDCDNGGAGLPGAIDVSSFAQDEPILKVVADTVNTEGTLTGQFPVDMGGTVYYVPLYTTGTTV